MAQGVFFWIEISHAFGMPLAVCNVLRATDLMLFPLYILNKNMSCAHYEDQDCFQIMSLFIITMYHDKILR